LIGINDDRAVLEYRNACTSGATDRRPAMRFRALKASRWVLGAAIGVACLLIGDPASVMETSNLIAQANATAGRPLKPLSTAGVARRTTRRAVVGGAAIPLNLGYSAGVGAYYGYAPGGRYGGVGCHPGGYGVLVCPP
jgi:hypothetical protein